MIVVPLQALKSQTLQVQLGNQACNISVFQQQYMMGFSLSVGTTPIVTSASGQNLNRMIRDAYLGFSGDFVFVDTQGSLAPLYWGLGSRWQLLYLSPADLAAFGFSA